jgi:hypothetical protein
MNNEEIKYKIKLLELENIKNSQEIRRLKEIQKEEHQKEIQEVVEKLKQQYEDSKV